MLQKNNRRSALITFLQFFFALLSGYAMHAQIYYHNFGTTTISTHPYTAAPTTLNPDLSGSSWTNSNGVWTSNNGATGQAISANPSPNTITLTFNVAPNFQANIASFNFWRVRSNSGPTAWQMSINGINVGTGSMPTTGSATGVTPVANPVNGLTGTVTVVLTMTGASAGNMRIDDFTLNGTVTSTCTDAVVTSYFPHSGPKDTMITITGSGFTDTATVKIDGITMAFEVISDTEVQAMIPAGVTSGNIVVTATNGCIGQGGTPFTLIASDCTPPEIYISEVFDQTTGDPGFIELYNPSSSPVVLDGVYVIERYGNIGEPDPSPGYIIPLTGTIAPNTTYLIQCGSSVPNLCQNNSNAVFQAYMGGINDNDQFKLKKNGVLIDMLNIPYGVGTGPANRGYTMIRKPNAVAPAPSYNGADWNASNTESCTNIGMHTANPVSGGPVPVINHPAPSTICVGANTTFTATVVPATGFTYQWKILTASGNWVNVANSSTYSGATTTTLTVSGASVAIDGSQYYLQATSADCIIRTDAAQLFVMDKPAAPTVTVTQPTCATPTGSIEITAPLGPDLTYSINGVNYAAGTTFNNLTPGTTYSITVKNIAGCISNVTTQAINTVPGAPSAPVLSATQPTCAVATGTITVTPAAGTGYTYSLDGQPYQTGATFTTVAPGPHTVTVQQNGCTSVPSAITIDPQPATPAAPTLTATQPTCTTGTGSITITNPTGTGFSYSLDGGTYQDGVTFSNVAPESHNVVVKNAAGCVSAPASITIDAVPNTPATPILSAVQPTCATATGSITITNPGGAGYTYSLDGGPYQAAITFNTVASGPHSVIAKNNAGCVSAPGSITIDPQPSTPAAPVLSATQPTCTTATGTITITPAAGTGYTYSLDGQPYQTGTTFTSVATGPHTITVQQNGCTSAPASITIDPQPATPAAPVVTATQPNCNTPTGTITITPASGTGYTYSLDGQPYQNGTTFTSVVPGSHTVTVQQNGCTSASSSITIDAQPATPAAPTLTATQPTCTTATGTITVTPAAGTGYTYSLDGQPYQAGTTFTSVATGPHSVTVQQNGCTSALASITIDAQPVTPAAPVLTATQPTCTTATGTITVTPAAGTGYTYSLDGQPYQTGTTFNSVAPGPHTVTVQQNGGCTSAPASITINAQPATPAAPTLTATQPTCTTATGTITVTPAAGTGYTYSLDGLPYQTGATYTSVAPGLHTVTVQQNGCTSAASTITIDPQPATPDAPVVSATQPNCTIATGTITVTPAAGTGYTYSLDGQPFQAGTTFNNVATGPHTVRVQQGGCISAPTSITIDAQPATPAAPILTATQPTCTTATGSISVTPVAGTGYSYSIDGQPYQTGTTFGPLSPGPHSVTVQRNGCISAPATMTINPQPATPAAPTLTATHPVCGTPTGTITVSPGTGTGFTYSIDGSPYQTGTTFTSVAPGPHTITVKSPEGCVSPATTQTINPALPVPAQPVLSLVQPTCTTSTGTITVTSPVGGGLSYSIDGSPFQTGNIFNNVAPGPHTIIVKNAEGCNSAPKTETINPVPTAPGVPVLLASHPGCGGTKGIITVTSPVGNGFTYSIDGVAYQVSASFANLDPGTYTITVKNTAGCISVPATGTINNPPAIPVAPTVTIAQPNCTTTTGSITVTAPIEAGMVYSINSLPFQAGPTFNGLAPGNYVITSRNAAGCVSGYTHFIINYPPLTPAIPAVTLLQPDCTKGVGTITVNSPVGFGLEYSIDGVAFQPSRIFNNVLPNTYTITVRNNAGCSAQLTGVTIDAPPAPAPAPGIITGDSAVCEGGTVQLANTVTTGTWSSSDTAIATVDATGLVTTLAPGTVTISYTTGTICTAVATHIITINNLPQPELRDMFLCVNNDTGIIAPGLLMSGVTGPAYTYEWSKDGTVLTNTAAAIMIDEPGEYSVKVTNTVTGCEGTSSATVGTSSLALGYADASIDFYRNQTITVYITGGSGDYEYSLDGGPYQDEPYFTNIYEGQYHITVKDKHGCGLLELDVYALNYPRFFSPNGDGVRDTWNIDGLALQPDAKIYIFDRYGKVIAGLKPGGPGWDGTYNGATLPATDYWFTLEYRSESGQPKEFKAHFSLLR
ncbi:T9SS type B sorting domain-containing protein [Flavobacterium sp.]|uniref:T9SS type B sorting domain-containing protein n=3 Tax=Flavobacterium sp. TaxID=239 RepID=UPI00403359DB